MHLDLLEDGQRPAHARRTAAVGGLTAPGLMAGQFLDDARFVRDLVMR